LKCGREERIKKEEVVDSLFLRMRKKRL